MRCPFCHNADSRVIDSREADEGATTRRRRSCPKCRSPVHHRRGGGPRRRQAQRGQRAVQPLQGGRRRPAGLPGPAGRRGPAAAARPAGRGRHPRHRRGRGARATRSGWPSCGRSASSTRSPTCASPASTASFTSRGGLREGDRRAARRAQLRCRHAPTPSADGTRPRPAPSPATRELSVPPARHRPRARSIAALPQPPIHPASHPRARRPGRAPHHDRDRRPPGRLTHPPHGQGAEPGQGPEDQARLHHRRCAPLRRGDLGAPRRRHDQLA